MAFNTKRIDVKFTLAPQENNPQSLTVVGGEADQNSKTLRGYRVSATIVKAGGIASQGQLQLRIYGMSLDLMNQFSTLGKTPIYVGKNIISVFAGDDTGTSLVFQGTMNYATTDLSGAPEASFNVSASSLLYQAVQTIPATSYRGRVEAALILQGLATQMGLSFENNGVTAILENPCYSGSALSQTRDCIQEAGIEWNQGDNGILAIWPKGGSRGGAIPLVAPETGLIGYPFPSGNGLLGLRTLFNPQINFGAKIEVRSEIAPAVGVWSVCSLTHDLESETPGGAWFTSLVGTPPGYLTVG